MIENERFYFDAYRWYLKENNQEVEYVKEGEVIGDRMAREVRGPITLDEKGRPVCVVHNKLMKLGHWQYGMDRAFGWYCQGTDEKKRYRSDLVWVFSPVPHLENII